MLLEYFINTAVNQCLQTGGNLSIKSLRFTVGQRGDDLRQPFLTPSDLVLNFSVVNRKFERFEKRFAVSTRAQVVLTPQ